VPESTYCRSNWPVEVVDHDRVGWIEVFILGRNVASSAAR
jgi:hypothetical protein